MKIFYLPDLGEGLAEAEIREWYVKVGDQVVADQPLVSVETAKAVVDVPAPYAGQVQQLYGQPKDIIQTGAPLIAFAGEEKVAAGSIVGHLEESTSVWHEEAVTLKDNASKTPPIKALPAVRALAKQLKVDLQNVTPTGSHGEISAEDIKQYAAQSQTVHQNGREKLHGVRRSMAQFMAAAHQEVVPVTIIEDADITQQNTADFTLCLLQAMIFAIQHEPALNAWFYGASGERQICQEINIGIAMDSEEGLLVPVLKNIKQYSAGQLREKIEALKKAVRERHITPVEMQGATITLSNFGSIAGRYATPIIIPPTVAILGCGRVRSAPVVRAGQLLPGKIAPLSLTFDHRALTGGEAARFLKAVVDYLEQKS